MTDSCKKYENLFESFLAGELSHKLASEMEEHIAICPYCMEQYRIAKLIETTLTPELQIPPPGFAKAVSLRIEDIANSQSVPGYGKIDLWWLAPWVAGIFTVIMLFINFFKVQLPPVTLWAPKLIASPFAFPALLAMVLMVTGSILSLTMLGILARKR